MKRTLLPLAAAAAAFFTVLPGLATTPAESPRTAVAYDSLQARAYRFYAHREWHSVIAMCWLMLDEKPDRAETYAQALTAATVAGDTLAQGQLTTAASRRGLAPEPVFSLVRSRCVALGDAALYVDYLNRVKVQEPWLARAVDGALARYYAGRRDGQATLLYSDKMLQGLPDSREYLTLMARGYLDEGNIAAAMKVWSHILTLFPDDTEALLWLGNGALAAGDKESALAYLAKANSLKPTPWLARKIRELKEVP